MKSQTNVDTKSLEQSVNDGWGEWVEQGPTEDSNEWFEEQRRKEDEIDQAEKERVKQKKLTPSLQEQLEIAPQDRDERLEVLAEEVRKLRELAVDFNNNLSFSLNQRRNSDHLFFTSRESASSTLPTKEEEKNEQSCSLSFSCSFSSS